MNAELSNLLTKLKLAALETNLSRDSLLASIEKLLVWLNQSENNTDDNCQQVDHFVSIEIISDKRFEKIPEDIKGILFDMGATLHDTHTDRKIAENFESTPFQLLTRIQKIYHRTQT